MEDRLAAICRAVDAINLCVDQRGNEEQKWLYTIGECDWLGELERLLYDEE